jgi:hypothetical protein
MNEQPRQDRPSLDGQAFTLILSAIFTCTLTWVAASVIDPAQAPPAATLATAPSQQGCARL